MLFQDCSPSGLEINYQVLLEGGRLSGCNVFLIYENVEPSLGRKARHFVILFQEVIFGDRVE